MRLRASGLLCLALCGGLASLGLSTPAFAQQDGASANGRAQAQVVRALRARPLADLSFGALVVGQSSGGEVIVSPSGSAASYRGSVRASCLGNAGCSTHPASFAVEGEGGRTYRISLPASIMAQGSRTSIELPVTSINSRSRNFPAASFGGLLDASGHDFFEVGGTLLVPAGTRADVFRADLPVTVSYD